MNREYKTIFSAVLARNLIKKGFIVKDIKPNIQDRRRTVFIFENTKELNTAISNYTKR